MYELKDTLIAIILATIIIFRIFAQNSEKDKQEKNLFDQFCDGMEVIQVNLNNINQNIIKIDNNIRKIKKDFIKLKEKLW